MDEEHDSVYTDDHDPILFSGDLLGPTGRGNEKTSVNTASNLKCTKDSAYKKLVQARMLESKEQQPHDEWTLVTRRKARKR